MRFDTIFGVFCTFEKEEYPEQQFCLSFIMLWLLLVLQRCSDSLRRINTMTQVELCVRLVSNMASSTEWLTADVVGFFPVMILGAIYLVLP